MFDVFGDFQALVAWGLLIVAIGLKIFAFVDTLRQRADAFPAAGKQTKQIWLAITGAALAVNIVVLSPLNFLNLIGTVAAIVYIVEVRPKLRQVSGGDGRRMGPYGPW